MLLYLVGAAVCALLVVFQRLPPGTVTRGLVAHPSWLLLAAALVLVPAAALGSVDFLRVRQRSYVPPSRRVQVARAALYGVCLTGAQLLAILAWQPRLIPLLAGAGWQALVVALPVPAYALAAWWLVLKPRVFVVPPLSSFQETAAALSDTNDFLIGRWGSNWKTGEGDPAWFVIPESGMFCNLYCLGGIGSGKTHTVVKPLVEQALFKWPGPPARQVLYGPPGRQKRVRVGDMKLGMFVLDASKGNLAAELIIPRARAAGRLDDVLIISPSGVSAIGRELTADEQALADRLVTVNPLASGSPQALALRLVTALTVMTRQEPNSYYLKMQREFATAAFSILHETLGPGKFTFMDLWRFICEEDFQQALLDQAKQRASVAWRWFANQWAKEDPHERMMLTKGFRADLGQFVTDELRPTFCDVKASFPGWRSILDEGRIVVFSMNRDEWGDMARALAIFLLMDFQDQVLARTTTRFKASGGNTERLVLVVADEAWAYLNPKWAEFTAVSRESRCCTVALHQGLDQIPLEYRATLIGNHRTHIILGINDPLSTETFSRVFGTHRVMRESRSESSGFSGVEHHLLADRLTARAGGESRSISVSHTEVDVPRFAADEIQRIPKWHAIVQLFDGDVVRPPKLVSLLPGHLHQLGSPPHAQKHSA